MIMHQSLETMSDFLSSYVLSVHFDIDFVVHREQSDLLPKTIL